MLDPATSASISALGMVMSMGTSRQRPTKKAMLHLPFLLLKPTPAQTTKSSLAASTSTHRRIFVSMASTGILGLVNLIPLHFSTSRKFLTHLDLDPISIPWSHVGVTMPILRRSLFSLAVRGMSKPLMSKMPITLDVTCLLVNLRGTKFSMSVMLVLSPLNVLVLGESLPRTTFPKCRS